MKDTENKIYGEEISENVWSHRYNNIITQCFWWVQWWIGQMSWTLIFYQNILVCNRSLLLIILLIVVKMITLCWRNNVNHILQMEVPCIVCIVLWGISLPIEAAWCHIYTRILHTHQIKDVKNRLQLREKTTHQKNIPCLLGNGI